MGGVRLRTQMTIAETQWAARRSMDSDMILVSANSLVLLMASEWWSARIHIVDLPSAGSQKKARIASGCEAKQNM